MKRINQPPHRHSHCEEREAAELRFLRTHACDRIRELRAKGAPEALILRYKLDLKDYIDRLDALNCK